MSAKIQQLYRLAEQPEFWHNVAIVDLTLQQLDDLTSQQQQYYRWKISLEDAKAALELLMLEQDKSLLQEAKTKIKQLNRELEQFELHKLLCDPYDKNGAFLTINAGTDDADTQDWAEMLLRMYACWGEFHGYQLQIVEAAYGDYAGIKSATLEIEGRYACGYLKAEIGTHRVKRLSPFNPSSKRITSFASVEVVPILDNSVEFEIPLQDLEIIIPPRNINTNGVKTGVGIVHIPTGLGVFCDRNRSQLQNKEKAIAILKSKLYAIAISQNVASITDIQPDKIKPVRPNPIREYVFHPYQLVKDLRTGVETTAFSSVMDGKIDLFLKAYLHQIYQPPV